MPALAPIFRVFALFLTLGVALIPALAQDPTPTPGPIQMGLSSPFALTAKPLLILARRGRWFPVAVTLSNTGDPVAGNVRLRLVSSGDFDNPPNDFYSPVDLPTNAHKVVWLYGRMERNSIAAIEVSFSGRGFPALTERIPVQEPEENQRVVLTVTDTEDGLSDTLKSLRGSGLSLNGAANPTGFNPTGSQGPLRPLEITHDMVPDRFFGLETADTIVLGDFPHTALLPNQITALHNYVAGGGNMLALGGANTARLNNSPLADLWPLKLGSSTTASVAQVAGLVHRYVENPRNGGDRLGGAPVVLANGVLKPDAQLRDGSASNPLFSLMDNGAGRVLFLSYDPSQPPFNGWSGQNKLWSDIFKATAQTRRLDSVDGDYISNAPNFSGNYYGYGGGYGNGAYNNDDGRITTLTGKLFSTMSKAPQLSMPPVSNIAWFLALYVFVLVPLNYAVLRLIDRRELAWVTIPVIVAAFSIFAYSAALSIRGRAILTRQVDIVQSTLGSKTARTDSLLWLFSPAKTTYDVTSETAGAAVADYANDAGGKQGSFSILQPGDNASLKVEGANVWMWTDRDFSGQAIPSLGKGLTLNGDRVQNGLSLDLLGAVWVQDRGVRRIGDIKQGASAPIPAKADEAYSSVDLTSAITRASKVETIFDSKTMSNNIPAGALDAALGDGYGLQNSGVLLVAWAKTPLSPLSIGVQGARSSDLTLFIFRVPPIQNPRVASREATVTRTAFEPNPGDTSAPGSNGAARGGTTFFDCLLPPAKTWQLTVRGTGMLGQQNFPVPSPPGITSPPVPPVVSSTRVAAPTTIHIEAWNAGKNRWLPLNGEFRREETPGGAWKFSAKVPADMPRQPDRLLQLRIRCDNSRSQVSTVRVTS